MNEDAKQKKARENVKAVRAAAKNIAEAVAAGRPVDLADAKVLEAAGCWFRRQMTSA